VKLFDGFLEKKGILSHLLLYIIGGHWGFVGLSEAVVNDQRRMVYGGVKKEKGNELGGRCAVDDSPLDLCQFHPQKSQRDGRRRTYMVKSYRTQDQKNLEISFESHPPWRMQRYRIICLANNAV